MVTHLTPDTSEVPEARAVTRRFITHLTTAVKRKIARHQPRQVFFYQSLNIW